MELNDVIDELIQKCIHQKREEAEASLALPIASPEQIWNVQVKLEILERFNAAVTKILRERKLYHEMMETAFPKLGETPSTDELTQKHNQVLANVCLLLKLNLKKIDSGIDQAECIQSFEKVLNRIGKVFSKKLRTGVVERQRRKTTIVNETFTYFENLNSLCTLYIIEDKTSIRSKQKISTIIV
jgi:hypothetical protein